MAPISSWGLLPTHNITLPTEAALRSLGVTVTHGVENLSGAVDEKFVTAIIEHAQILEGIRDRATANHHGVPGTPRLIVTVPSVFRHLSPSGLKRDTPGPIRSVVRHILRQQQYIAMRPTRREDVDALRDPLARAALAARGEELRAYTAALSVTAASLCAPVVRCPPQVDRVRELLVRLSGLERGCAPSIERRNKLARDIGTTLRAAIATKSSVISQIIRTKGLNWLEIHHWSYCQSMTCHSDCEQLRPACRVFLETSS